MKSTTMEIGDYFPPLEISNGNRKLRLHTFADKSVVVFFVNTDIHRDFLNDYDFGKLSGRRHLVITNTRVESADRTIYSSEPAFSFFCPDYTTLSYYVCDRNLKIVDIRSANSIEELGAPENIVRTEINQNPPILTVPNVVSAEHAQALISYLDEKSSNIKVNDSEHKSRSHTQLSTSLEESLDRKLLVSLVPEIEKVFLCEISHRENYKVCKYSGDKSGKFSMHRDTIDPFLHRRLAMTLVLNDDFDGGGICFPEYSEKVIAVPKYSAVIFPGSLLHEVKQIQSGNRYVIISFLFTAEDAMLKEGSHRYRFKCAKPVYDFDTVCLKPLGVKRGTDDENNQANQIVTQSTLQESDENGEESNRVQPPATNVVPNKKVAFVQKAIEQSLFSKARSIASTIADPVEEARLLKLIAKATEENRHIYIQIAGDSLSLPRPYYLKEFDADSNPFLSTTLYETYPLLLEESIQSKYQNKKVRVDTSLCGRGFKITNLTERLPDIFSYRSPSIVVIHVGIVDCWRRGPNLDRQDVPIEKFTKNISNLLEYRRIACYDTPVVFIGLCPTDSQLYKRNTGMNAIISEYNEAIKNLILADEHTYFLDMESILDSRAPYDILHKDGIHFSTQGHERVATELGLVIKNVLAKN